MKITFVIPRFAPGLVGGAETLAHQLLTHLPPDRYEREVWTTCALDHHSWADHFPPGADEVDGIPVHRFRTNERNTDVFLHHQHRIHNTLPMSLEDEMAWLRESVNSDDLLEHIAVNGGSRDALVFLPYLFGVTLTGSAIHPQRSVLIPCLHDEPYAYLRVVRHLLESVRGVIFNAEPERDLAERLVGLDAERTAVVGMGFEAPAAPEPGAIPGTRFRAEAGIEGPYVLYFGRKEEGKNTNWLAREFARRAEREPPAAELVFAGSGELEVPERVRALVHDVDYMDEELKRDAIRGALAVCQPSVNESFSIVLMEAWLEGRPVLVHGRCAVTREHARACGGGLWFENGDELGGCIDFLAENPEMAMRMGAGGRAYVQGTYGWPAVIGRFDEAMERFFRDGGKA